ncbi:MAG TPA: NAD-dependent epimerase/dehydratase family protein, partial [Pseudomonadota bacterium]|nr:NAD-dependent epimerase/dehydratase family protein [Pseudomonadota bacterium]
NLLLGRRRNIAHLENLPDFHFVECDLLNRTALRALFADARFDAVFHMAANSDISAGTSDFQLDLKLNQLTTVALLEAMKAHAVKRLFFASSSAVFGETNDEVLHEDFGPLQPISFYGASKLAAEAYISVFAHTFGGRAVLLRFPNVVGERATHGVICDFLRKLEANREELKVLGDGMQSKPYLYVRDLVDAILLAWDKSEAPLAVYHAAGIGNTSVREIAQIVVAAAGRAETRIVFTGGDRGWPGDVPRFRYDISRLQELGWQPQRHSTDAVRHAVERILANGF